MRTWLKPFLLTVAAILGASALWVWAVPMTGNTGKNMQFTAPNEFDIGGILRANSIGLHQLGTDPAPGPDWLIYTLSSGPRVRDPAGNIKDLTGGTGGGSTAITVARVATTPAAGNITLSGTQTVDGISVGAGGETVLVKDQSTGTQNGLYVASTLTWTRATSFDTSAEFTAGFPVYVQPGGILNGNTLWNFSVVGAFTLGTTNVTFGRTGPGSLSELLSNKNAASGYAGLTSTTKLIWTQRGDAAIHPPIAAPGQITPTASTMRVSGSGTPPVTMSSGDPRILGCATTADDGKELTIEGSDATNTLTMPNGQGVQLCGNTGSITFGLNLARASFVCDGLSTPKVWRQSDCQDLQQAFNISNKIVTGSTEATGFQLTDPTGVNRCTTFWDAANGNVPTTRCFCSGTLCPQTNFGPLPVGGSLRVLNNANTPIFTVNENGTIVGANFGKAVLGNSDFGTVTCPTAGTPRQYPLIGSYSTTVLNEVQMRMPRAGTMANLYARSWAAIPAGDAVVLTLQKAGANTALTCPMNAAATTCEDTTHSVSVAAGDLMSLQVTCTGSTSPIGPINFTLTLE